MDKIIIAGLANAYAKEKYADIITSEITEKDFIIKYKETKNNYHEIYINGVKFGRLEDYDSDYVDILMARRIVDMIAIETLKKRL